MKKRIYRAKRVKSLNTQKLVDLVQGRQLTIAVDIAKAVLFAALVLENRECICLMKWNQLDQSECRQALDLLRELMASAEQIALVLEPSGTYGDPLRHQASAMGLPVYKVSPKRSHDYSEVFDGVPSQHDGKSAVLLARLHLEGLSQSWELTSELRRDLDALRKEADVHQDALLRNQGRLEGWAARHWPELHKILDLDRRSTLELLAEYGSPDRVAASSVEAGELMWKVGRGGLKRVKIDKVLRSAEETMGVRVSPSEAQLVKTLAREILRSREAVNEVKKRIESKADSEPAIAAMTPVIGLLTSVTLLVEVGDPRQFSNARAFVKGAGLNLRERSSGQYRGCLRITKRGSGRGRKYLYLAALRLIQRDHLVAAWYRRKVRRDGGRVKKKAIVAIMRKLMASLWHVARGASFDASKLYNLSVA